LSVTVTPVAFAAVTVSVLACPLEIVAGLAVIFTVGAVVVGFTVTVVAAVLVPPAPVAVAV
jgi:hypothetical protein